jgi:archaellum component FlaG (FlaF/FlaG flagellin family)
MYCVTVRPLKIWFDGSLLMLFISVFVLVASGTVGATATVVTMTISRSLGKKKRQNSHHYASS